MTTTVTNPEEYDLVGLGSGEGGKYLTWNLGSERTPFAEVVKLFSTLLGAGSSPYESDQFPSAPSH